MHNIRIYGLLLITLSGCELAVSRVAPAPTLAIAESRLPDGIEGEDYHVTLTAVGGENGGFVWQATEALPAGLTLTSYGRTASLAGTPPPGTHRLTIAVTDAAGTVGRRDWTLHVRSSLRLAEVTLPEALVGHPYDAILRVDGGTGDGLRWQAAHLPAGLALVAASGRQVHLAGTALEPWSGELTVTVSDESGAQASDALALRIAPRLAWLTGDALPDGAVAGAYWQTLATEGRAETRYGWALTAGVLPEGLTVATEGTRQALLHGTPTASGVYDFTLTVTIAESPVEEIARSFHIVIDYI